MHVQRLFIAAFCVVVLASFSVALFWLSRPKKRKNESGRRGFFSDLLSSWSLSHSVSHVRAGSTVARLRLKRDSPSPFLRRRRKREREKSKRIEGEGDSAAAADAAAGRMVVSWGCWERRGGGFLGRCFAYTATLPFTTDTCVDKGISQSYKRVLFVGSVPWSQLLLGSCIESRIPSRRPFPPFLISFFFFRTLLFTPTREKIVYVCVGRKTRFLVCFSTFPSPTAFPGGVLIKNVRVMRFLPLPLLFFAGGRGRLSLGFASSFPPPFLPIALYQ